MADSLKHYKRFLTKWDSIRKLKKEPVTLILSPHMDDVFLSLNSAIVSHKLGTNIIAINVFTATDSLVKTNVKSDFKALANASLTRMKEELSYSDNLKTKKISYLPLFLGFKDAAVDTYYQFILAKQLKKAKIIGDKYVKKRAEELMFEEAIGSIMGQLESNIQYILAPMGIGDHLDHIMLRNFAESLANDFRIGLYADIPYISEYNYNSIQKLKSAVPKSFSTYDKISFNAKEKTSLFKKMYASQYDSGIVKQLKDIETATGEVIFWNR
ncbi:MAG: PIG-L family deacetylase [Candidatus Micrarchaeaceae archaeon]|jgi:hypothetical protein